MKVALPPAPGPSSPAVRASMVGNRRINTRPEAALRSALHRAGLRFRKDLALRATSRSVRPDIVFTRAQVAVFVDGCFWHSCPIHGHLPKSNEHYWEPKLLRNRLRDQATGEALRAAGWAVVRVWEHESTLEAAARVVEMLASRDGRSSS